MICAPPVPRLERWNRRRLRELHGIDRLQAAHRVMRWRFPRAVEDYELVLGHWFAWGSMCVFWLVPDQAGPYWSVHLATAYGANLSPYAKDFEALLVVLGDLLGADALYAQLLPGTASERAIRKLVRRLGWHKEGPRWYLSLRAGGVEVGVEAEEASEGTAGASADR